jgi:hypothetical protein
MRVIPALAVLALASACVATRSEVVDPKVAAASSEAQFALLKSLVGTWKGDAGEGEQRFPAEVTYRLTGGGSALVETLFPGSEHEMVTVYHRDGPWLVLTHYCALGNQPRMRAVHAAPPPAGLPATIEFEFVGATNLASPEAMHMHSARFELLDKDHMRGTWTSYDQGKPGHVAQFDMRRQDAR